MYKSEKGEKLLDSVGLQILRELQENARTPLAEIGRRVNLTPPAVAERVRRMEEAGIITGYHAHIDPDKVGLSITAFIRLALYGPCTPEAARRVAETHNMSELYFMTGDNDLLIKSSFASMADLDHTLKALSEFGEPSTSIVFTGNSMPYRSLSLSYKSD
jgi:Lrp/AsnC family leucine-responsive transcriptional regulator